MDATGAVSLNHSIGRAVATRRHQLGLSARALAVTCQEAGIKGLDRNRVANIELARGRPIGVQEWLGLAYVMRSYFDDLLLGESPKYDVFAFNRDNDVNYQRYNLWCLETLSLADNIVCTRGQIATWVGGDFPAWGDETNGFPESPAPRPEMTREELMASIVRLGEAWGLRVSFEPLSQPRG
jgi:hypothetical protein